MAAKERRGSEGGNHALPPSPEGKEGSDDSNLRRGGQHLPMAAGSGNGLREAEEGKNGNGLLVPVQLMEASKQWPVMVIIVKEKSENYS